MKEFFIQNWKLLAVGVLLILEIILLIFKRPVKVLDTIHQEITNVLISALKYAEQKYPSGYGDIKLQMVLEIVHLYLAGTYGMRSEDIVKYDDFIKEKVEELLSTPQKKGESNENKISCE